MHTHSPLYAPLYLYKVPNHGYGGCVPKNVPKMWLYVNIYDWI